MAKLFIGTILSLFLFFNGDRGVRNDVVKLYVAPNGADNNDGSLSSPFLTISKAKDRVATLISGGTITGEIHVILRKGVYTLSQPLIFSSKDSGNEHLKIFYEAYNNEDVVISGGKKLTGTWQRDVGNSNIWKLNIPEAKNRKWIFRQLFSNNGRVKRASSDFFMTAGPLPAYKDSIKRFSGWAAILRLKANNLDALCGFNYTANDLDDLQNIDGVEVIVYHSWECSWQSIYKIDKQNKLIYFTSPFRYPVGYFGDHERYRIENSAQFFSTGQWYLDVHSGVLRYYARANENPNEMAFNVPYLQELVKITGDAGGSSVAYLNFYGIKFKYTSYPWGVNSIEDKFKVPNPKYPWINFQDGFSSSQGAFDAGQAVLLFNAKYCNFDHCDFSSLGNYALKIGEYSSYNKIVNCNINDVGAGGVIVGFINNIKKSSAGISPSYNSVVNNKIFDGGIVHPSGIGVILIECNNTLVQNNEIYNFPYSGISSGFTFGFHDNLTRSNSIKYNNIHDVMQQLADGAGIYTLGPQLNTSIVGNYVHNIKRAKLALGGESNGIFFDEGSSAFHVDSNVVSEIDNKDFRFNQTDSTKIEWGKNFFQKRGQNQSLMNIIKIKAGRKR